MLSGIDLPILDNLNVVDRYLFANRRSGLCDALLHSVKREVLRKVVSIAATVHKVRLNGPHRSDEIKCKLGGRKRGGYIPKFRNPNYNYSLYHYIYDFEFEGFYTPTQPYYPQCEFQLFYPPKRVLQIINDQLSGMQAVEIEYALDLICANNIDAENLFALLSKYVVARNVRTRNNRNESLETRSDYRSDINSYYAIGSSFKMYTRVLFEQELLNPISMRSRKNWNKVEIVVLRLELTADVEQLESLDIRSLPMFLEDAKFQHFWDNKVRFAIFDGSRSLPREHMLYKKPNSDKPWGFMMDEHLLHRSSVKNIYQYVIDAPHLERILPLALQQAGQFDVEWQQMNNNRTSEQFEDSLYVATPNPILF